MWEIHIDRLLLLGKVLNKLKSWESLKEYSFFGYISFWLYVLIECKDYAKLKNNDIEMRKNNWKIIL